MQNSTFFPSTLKTNVFFSGMHFSIVIRNLYGHVWLINGGLGKFLEKVHALIASFQCVKILRSKLNLDLEQIHTKVSSV